MRDANATHGVDIAQGLADVAVSAPEGRKPTAHGVSRGKKANEQTSPGGAKEPTVPPFFRLVWTAQSIC